MYQAFISYSHATDGKLAPALQSALQGFAKPWNRLRAIRLFRDQTNLATNPDLWPSIEKAIDDSEYLLLMASPDAANSPWVPREVDAFLRTNPPEKILLILTDGDLNWDERAVDFDPKTTTAFPRLERKAFNREPLYLDLRWARKQEHLSMRNPAFRDAVADLSSTLRGIPKDILTGQDVREHKKSRRLARTAVALLVSLILAVGIVAYAAFQQRNLALQRLVRLSVTNATQLVDDGDLCSSLPWLIEAMSRGDSSVEPIQRVRIASVLHQCPKLAQAWFPVQPLSLMVLSQDGRRVVTASGDLLAGDKGTVQVWEASSGKAVTKPLLLDKGVLYVAFSPDGERIVAATGDKNEGAGVAQVWNASNGEPLATLRHVGTVLTAEFSPNGQYLVTASVDFKARVWDIASGTLAARPLEPPDTVAYAAFSPDGLRVLTADGPPIRKVRDDADPKARVWEVRTGRLLVAVPHQSLSVHPQFNRNGRRIVTAVNQGNAAQIWDASSGNPVTLPLSHSQPLNDLAFSSDGSLVVTASEDRAARVWDATTGNPQTEPIMHSRAVNGAAFSPDGQRVLTWSGAINGPGAVQVWDVSQRDTKAVTPPLNHGGRVVYAALTPSGLSVVTGSRDDVVRLWNINQEQDGTTTLESRVEPSRPDVRLAVFNPIFNNNGTRLLAVDELGAAVAWHTATGKFAFPPITASNAKVKTATFSSDGHRIVTIHEDETVRAWDASTGELIATYSVADRSKELSGLRLNQRFVVKVAGVVPARIGTRRDREETPPATREAQTDDTSTARGWDLVSGKSITPPLRHRDEVLYGEFSRDGRHVVTASKDGTAVVWEAATGKSIVILRHGRDVAFATFSQDGRRVVTAGGDSTYRTGDGSARVWDTLTGRAITPPLNHASLVGHAAFTADGRWVVTTSWDETARVWDATTGDPITPPLKHDLIVDWAAFSPDARHLVTSAVYSNGFGDARLWDLSPDGSLREDLLRQAQLLSMRRLDAVGGLLLLDREEFRTVWELKP